MKHWCNPFLGILIAIEKVYVSAARLIAPIEKVYVSAAGLIDVCLKSYQKYLRQLSEKKTDPCFSGGPQ